MIKKCKCNHAFQDKKYGRHMRVHNGCQPEGGSGSRKFNGARCTVCGDVKLSSFEEGKG